MISARSKPLVEALPSTLQKNEPLHCIGWPSIHVYDIEHMLTGTSFWFLWNPCSQASRRVLVCVPHCFCAPAQNPLWQGLGFSFPWSMVMELGMNWSIFQGLHFYSVPCKTHHVFPLFLHGWTEKGSALLKYYYFVASQIINYVRSHPTGVVHHHFEYTRPAS